MATLYIIVLQQLIIEAGEVVWVTCTNAKLALYVPSQLRSEIMT